MIHNNVSLMLSLSIFAQSINGKFTGRDRSDYFYHRSNYYNSTAPFTDKLYNMLTFDEGFKDYIYNCAKGVSACGIGHKINRSDPEFEMPQGTKISQDRIKELYREDVSRVVDQSKIFYPFYEELPEKAKLVVINMMFTLGVNGQKKFEEFNEALQKRNWNIAASWLRHSQWYWQKQPRVSRLIELMRTAENTLPIDMDFWGYHEYLVENAERRNWQIFNYYYKSPWAKLKRNQQLRIQKFGIIHF